MKKRTLSLLLAVACALSLSGCGGAPAPDAQTSAPAAAPHAFTPEEIGRVSGTARPGTSAPTEL